MEDREVRLERVLPGFPTVSLGLRGSQQSCVSTSLLLCAALGHLDVLRAVVDVLQSSAAALGAGGPGAGGPGGGDEGGCLKEPSIALFAWGRFVKDVMNARTTSGKTPLMLACENGWGPCGFAPMIPITIIMPHHRCHVTCCDCCLGIT